MGSESCLDEAAYAELLAVDLPYAVGDLVGDVEQFAVGRKADVDGLRSRPVQLQLIEDSSLANVDEEKCSVELTARHGAASVSREIQVIDADAACGHRILQLPRPGVAKVQALESFCDDDC